VEAQQPGIKTILSIDGGGIRGIIPAMILAHIEKKTGTPVYRLFDMVAGTSTGGIIALGLTKKGADGANAYTAARMVELFQDDGSTIFPHPWWDKVRITDGLWDQRYPSDGIEQTLTRLAGDAKLKDALTNVLVTSYDIQKRDAVFFKSWAGKDDPACEFTIRDIARATSAAPTYFEPHKIEIDRHNYYSLIDGGVVAGNPTLCAFVDAREVFEGSQFFILSLGTGQVRHPYSYVEAKDWGKISWAQPIIDIVMDASNHQVDHQVRVLQRTSQSGSVDSYYRLQPDLNADLEAMDDSRPENVRGLRDLTEAYLSDPARAHDLDEACEKLKELKGGK
jgi:uncharacterized protein